jgi:hypothetical protein
MRLIFPSIVFQYPIIDRIITGLVRIMMAIGPWSGLLCDQHNLVWARNNRNNNA